MAVALQFLFYAAMLQTTTKEKELPMEEAVKKNENENAASRMRFQLKW